jgi:DNA primase
MSGRIPQHFIDELIARADIVDVIGSRVTLKKGGKEYKACCPFHNEKSPSFTVVPDKQFYHCFGCGAHGTALGFLMEYDHLSFVEAVETLADRVGLQVPREEDPTAKPKPADDLYAPLERAAALYRAELDRSDRAIDYVKKRGLTRDIAERFAIGFAPDAWDFIGRQLGATDADARKLLQVGLVIERDQRDSKKSGHYDRFRDRIMFPIRDTRGRIIGFGGRVLDKGEPKYLNSPETELFHKGRELYGLFEARAATRSIKRLMVVEGYMDVVRLHQAGITYAVATLGTATTPEHLTRIFRICNEVVFCFDGDRAGRSAAWRALENSLPQIREGRQIRFLFLPEGHDPDSLVGEEGPEKFEARLDGALALSDYMIRELSARSDIKTVDGRAQLAETAKPLLARIQPGVYRELLIDALAQVVGMSADRLSALLATDAPAVTRSARPADQRTSQTAGTPPTSVSRS